MEKTEIKKKILFIVQFKYRDLPGLSLVKFFLEKQGNYEVILTPFISYEEIFFLIKNTNPHAIALWGMTSEEQNKYAQFLQEIGILVIVIPSEGTSFIPEIQRTIAGKFVDLRNIDLLFIWNKNVAKLTQKYGKISKNKYVVAGVPRFDIYHTKFKNLIISKEEFCKKYNINPNKKIITWATNFSWMSCIGKPKDIAIMSERDKKEGLNRNIPLLIDLEAESRNELTKCVLEVAKKFKETSIIIKVHPAEKKEWYINQVKSSGLENIIIIGQEYIWNLLNCSDVHLHRSCTTCIEAWFMNKPTIELQCAPKEWYCAKELFPGGDVIYSISECIKKVEYYLEGGEISSKYLSNRIKIINNFCEKLTGQSSLKHAKAIHNLIKKSTKIPKISEITNRQIYYSIKRKIKSIIGLKPHQAFLNWLKRKPQEDTRGKYFSKEDEKFWIENIEKCLTK